MTIKLLLAATLRKYVPGYDGSTGHDMEVEPGTKVKDVAEKLGIPVGEVKLIMVNGVGSKWDTAVGENDRVALFPPVGGG